MGSKDLRLVIQFEIIPEISHVGLKLIDDDCKRGDMRHEVIDGPFVHRTAVVTCKRSA